MEMIDIETDQRMEENQRRIRAATQAARRGSDSKTAIDYTSLGLQAPPVKIVAGNKCDLKDARVITSRQGLEWARKRGCGFMETSAREMVNIEETFALIVRRVVEARRLQVQHGGIDPKSSLLDKETAIFSSNQQQQQRNGNGNGRNKGGQQQKKRTFHDQQLQPNISISQTAPLSPLEEKYDAEGREARQKGRWKRWFRKVFCFRSK